MQIGLTIFDTSQVLSEGGIVLPQLVSSPSVDGTGLEGSTLIADQSDGWSYDAAAATVTDRQYRLLIDGVEVVGPQVAPSLSIPLNTVGSNYRMLLRVRVSQAPAMWSPWNNIASGTITDLPHLNSPIAAADGETNYTGSVSTDDGTGMLYWAVTETVAPPTMTALKSSNSQPVTSVGIQNVSGNGLASGTTYHIHFVQENDAAIDSAPVSSAPFTSNAPSVGEPGAFGPGDWSITDLTSGGDARLTITGLPDDGGTAFKAFFYNVDGGPWLPLPLLSTGSHDLIDIFTDDVATDVRLLAENLFGIGPESAAKSITTTTATVPAAFSPADWSITDLTTGGDAELTLIALPADGGSPIQNVQVSLDGGSWIPIPGANAPGSYTLADLFTDGAATDVRLRAINANGASPESAAQSVTTTFVPAAPAAFGAGDWSITDLATGGDGQISIAALPSGPVDDIEYRLDSGAWTSLSQANVGDAPLFDSFIDGVATDVQIRAVNAGGTGPASDTKTITTTAGANRPDAFTSSDWSIADAGTGGDATLTITAVPANGGSPLQIIQYSTTSATGGFGPIGYQSKTPGSYPLSNAFNDGVATNVWLRAVNANGAGPSNGPKSVTTTSAVGATAPEAFTASGWSVSNTNTPGEAELSIVTMPANGGSAISAVRYRVNGGAWTALSGVGTGDYTLSGLPDGALDLQIEAVNAVGASPVSDTKTFTQSGFPDAFTAGQWSVAGTGTAGEAALTISALPTDNGAPLTRGQFRVNAGPYTDFTATIGLGAFTLPFSFTDGVSADVEIRTRNGNGAGPDSDVKVVTTASSQASIDAGTGSYTNGSNPTLEVMDVSTSGTTGPFFLDVALLPGGTTSLSQADMTSGGGAVIEKLTLGPAANIEDLDGALTLTQALTNGNLFYQYRDNSAPQTLSGITRAMPFDGIDVTIGSSGGGGGVLSTGHTDFDTSHWEARNGAVANGDGTAILDLAGGPGSWDLRMLFVGGDAPDYDPTGATDYQITFDVANPSGHTHLIRVKLDATEDDGNSIQIIGQQNVDLNGAASQSVDVTIPGIVAAGTFVVSRIALHGADGLTGNTVTLSNIQLTEV